MITVLHITLTETRTDTGTMTKMETTVLFGNIYADQRQGQEQHSLSAIVLVSVSVEFPVEHSLYVVEPLE